MPDASDEEGCSGEYRLRDGTRVRIRPIRPDDARTLQDGFRALSPESRRRRFRNPKERLSPRELRHLTECDGISHLALGAVRLDAQGWECEGLGVARFVRLPDQPEVAEPVVTVVDAVQGQGLGRLLSEHLIRAAADRGVKTFRCLLLEESPWLRERIRRAYPDARLTRRGRLLGAEIPLPALAPRVEADLAEAAADGGPDARFWTLLRWVAQGAVRPRRPGALRRLAGRAWSRLAGPRGDAAGP